MPVFKTVKHKARTFFSLANHPGKLVLPASQNGLLNWIPDKTALKLLYRAEMGESLDLDHPVTFSEKIQWIKLFDRKSRYTMMVDKYLAKEIVASEIGEEYVIPTYAVWDDAKSVDLDALPNEFVIKCNHDSHGLVICRDKSAIDQKAVIRKMNAGLRKNAYHQSREWAYKDVKRKILAEKLIVDPKNRDLIDYKFFCFNGVPLYCQVIKNRSTGETIDFYDMDWNPMPFTGLGLGKGPERGTFTEKPEHYGKMRQIAEKLAQGTFFVRIDLYNVEGRILFGEFTLYPKSGLARFYPDEWNRKLGDLIRLE